MVYGAHDYFLSFFLKPGISCSATQYLCQPTQAWRLRQLGALDSHDQVVDNICFHPTVCGRTHKFEHSFSYFDLSYFVAVHPSTHLTKLTEICFIDVPLPRLQRNELVCGVNGNAHIVTEATDKASFTRADATLAVDVARIQTDFAASESLQVRVCFRYL
jgi:hypothetical protein